MSSILFEDYFEVKAINKDGTFFDRGRLTENTSFALKNSRMSITVDNITREYYQLFYSIF